VTSSLLDNLIDHLTYLLTDRQTDRQTDTEIYRNTDWQTDRRNCYSNSQTWSSNIRLKPRSRHIKTWTFHLTTIYVFIFLFMLYIHITSKKYGSIIFITRLCLESVNICQGENANQKWYGSLIQTSGLLWIRIQTSVLDSLPCRRQSFCQWHLSQAPPKQSAVCYTCIIPAPPANCQFIWMASAFAMSATQPILGWL